MKIHFRRIRGQTRRRNYREKGSREPEGRERPLTSQPHEHLDPGLLASRMEKNLFLLFQPPSLRHFAMAALADEYHCYCC